MNLLKKLTLAFSLLIFMANSSFALVGNPATKQIAGELAYTTNIPEFATMNLEQFLEITPNEVKEITGKKLTLKETVKLKLAQKKVAKVLGKKKPKLDSGVYVILVILGLGWLAMGLNDDWSGSDWLINLLLTALCWLPGVIHGLAKKSKWY